MGTVRRVSPAWERLGVCLGGKVKVKMREVWGLNIYNS